MPMSYFDLLPVDVIRIIVNYASDKEKLLESLPDQILEAFDQRERLLQAAKLGCLKHVKTALRDGADPNVPIIKSVGRIITRDYALHTAIRHEHEDIVAHLVDKGADPTLEDQTFEGYQTALYCAVQVRRENIVQIILDTGVQVDLGHRKIARCSIDDQWKYENENRQTSWISGKETPLQYACWSGTSPHMKIIKLLVERGAELNKFVYVTPLIHAVNRRDRNLTEYLLEAGADVNKIGYPLSFGGRGQSPLNRIMDELEDAGIKVSLLEAGANPDFNNSLVTAATSGNHEDVELLLRYGADPLLKSWWESKTALEAVKLIIQRVRPGPYRKSLKKIASILGDSYVCSPSDDERDGTMLYNEYVKKENWMLQEPL